MNEPNNNPFDASNVADRMPDKPSLRVHPVAIIAMLVASLFLGCCTFFVSCLGTAIAGMGEQVVFGLSSVLALVVVVGGFIGMFAYARKRRVRNAMAASQSAAANDQQIES